MDVVNSILNDEEQPVDPRKTTVVNKDTELHIDVGTFLVSDYNPLNTIALRSDTENYLTALTRDNVQLLINKVWELPTEHVEEAIVTTLPKPLYVLPRARCIPKPKPLTKWQQFAKEKGIRTKKKDKSKLKWDEELQKWIPTYGYKRNKLMEQKDWLVELNKHNAPIEDPVAAAKAAKSEKKSKNELQRLRNIAKARNVKLPRVGITSAGQYPSAQQLGTAVTVARTSTASVGKFQPRLPKEKDAKGIASEVPGIRTKRKEVPKSMHDEKELNKNLIDNILKRNTKVFTEDFTKPSLSVLEDTTHTKKDKKKKTKSKGAKKPKAGAGKRDLHQKSRGRKRR